MYVCVLQFHQNNGFNYMEVFNHIQESLPFKVGVSNLKPFKSQSHSLLLDLFYIFFSEKEILTDICQKTKSTSNRISKHMLVPLTYFCQLQQEIIVLRGVKHF